MEPGCVSSCWQERVGEHRRQEENEVIKQVESG